MNNPSQNSDRAGSEGLSGSHPCIAEVGFDAAIATAADALRAGKITEAQYTNVVNRVGSLRVALSSLRTAASNRGLVCPGTAVNQAGVFVCPFESDGKDISGMVNDLKADNGTGGSGSTGGGGELPALFSAASGQN